MNLLAARRFWPIAVSVLAVAAVLFYYLQSGTSQPRYTTAQVDRGPIVRAVTATGTVNPIITVQVGTYDSGPIIAIYADFNTPVKAGQLIAKIDPKPFKVKADQSTAALANTRAQLAKDQADMVYKKLTFERDSSLGKEGVISQDTVDNAHSAYDQVVAQIALDRANIQQQQANLEEAQVNLNYTDIISPVDGTVVSRNVDVGQTVAASFQTPTLFLIAKDLTQMQVDTNVSESDIGNLRNGQVAEFSVDAFPDREFEGTVGQVRKAPVTVQNVVTYDVVVDVPNPEFLLVPGMTANVTIVTARRDNVLRIPVQALRFTPGKDQPGATNQSAADKSSRQKRVWLADRGTLKPVLIVTGLNDGNYVEALSGDLKVGDMVVTSKVRSTDTGGSSAPSSSLRLSSLR
ncbi:MAG: efflux RND transporter periplasmic adaptor subunit [Candidatus Binataceae bacterium]